MGDPGLAVMAGLSKLLTPGSQQRTIHSCWTSRSSAPLLHG